MKNRTTNILLLYVFFSLLLGVTASAEDRDYWEESKRISNFKDARYGVFIHWSVCSSLGMMYKGEKVMGINDGGRLMTHKRIPIAEYERDYARNFKPHKFDADRWIKGFADAGIKYIVFTTKHIEGFSMWHSKTSRYNIVDTAGFRDVLKELSLACKKHDVKLGLYHALGDYYYDGGKKHNTEAYYENKFYPQLEELLTEYGDVFNLWLDGLSVREPKLQKKVYNFCRNLQPNVVINTYSAKDKAGDYCHGAADFPAPLVETHGKTANDWFFRKHSIKYADPKKSLTKLITSAADDHNHILNISPTGDGEITPEAWNILNYIGDWLKINGEAIHGAGGTKFGPQDWGYYTFRGGTLYMIVTNWPKSGKIKVNALRKPFTKARVLSGKFEVSIDKHNVLTLPQVEPKETYPVIALESAFNRQ